MTDSRDTETEDEAKEAAATGETPDEAHRAGEFDDLNAKLSEVIAKLDALSALITESRVKEPATDDKPSVDDSERLVSLDDIDFE